LFVAQLGITAGGAVPRVDLVVGGVRLVEFAGIEQLARHVGVDGTALALPVRAVRATDLDALVPVQPQPAQRVQQGLVALFRVPRRVGVLDPEDELALVVPGERQLNRAVRIKPTCGMPVGDGENRARTGTTLRSLITRSAYRA